MESHPVLSDAECIYVLSQTKEAIPKGYNLSEYRRRIRRKVKLAFEDFSKIMESRVLPQSFKDQVFDSDTVNSFLGTLTYYDSENPIVAEVNKQKIARWCMELGLGYFRQKYPALYNITPLNSTLTIIDEIVNATTYIADDKKAVEFYKTRGNMTIPPIIGESRKWSAECIICWRYASDLNPQIAVSLIRHASGCTFEKKYMEQCIKLIPPAETS